MVMAALTALKSTNFVLDIYYLGYLIVMNCVAHEVNRFQMESYLPLEKSVGGQTCQFWLVQESRYFSGFAALPDRGEGVFFQNRPVGKKKQPVAAFQTGAGFKQRCYAHGIRGDGQHAETMDAKFSLVDFLRPGCFVCEKFPVKRCLF